MKKKLMIRLIAGLMAAVTVMGAAVPAFADYRDAGTFSRAGSLYK